VSSDPLVLVAFPAPAPFRVGQPPAGVALVTIDRPESLNALSFAVLAQLVAALQALDAELECRCIVVTGAGPRAFAAGADVRELAGQTPESLAAGADFDHWDELREIGLPIIAAVRGYALGGGCELAMACDLIVAGEDAQFGQPEIKLGVIPGAGGTQRLTRAIGKARAMELILTGRSITAAEAQAAGLVSLVVPTEETLDRALELAGRIAAMPPIAVRAAKAMVNRVFDSTLTEGLADERRAFFGLFGTDDQEEGMVAFTEKRTPIWRGR
jgi:enoyl-CoA hydratase